MSYVLSRAFREGLGARKQSLKLPVNPIHPNRSLVAERQFLQDSEVSIVSRVTDQALGPNSSEADGQANDLGIVRLPLGTTESPS